LFDAFKVMIRPLISSTSDEEEDER